MRACLVAAIALTLSSPRAFAQTNDVDDSELPRLEPPVPAPNPGLSESGNFGLAPTESVQRSHPVRAVLETTLAFGLNVAWYWRHIDFNTPDWDLHWDWPSWKGKLTFRLVRFDSNRFS